MELDFWHDVWAARTIRFNQTSYNPKMVEFFSKHALLDKNIFVPLCGKSIDMLWLIAQGAKVVACEVSETAVQEFFDDNQITYILANEKDFKVYKAKGITIYCGDFFKLKLDDDFDFIYDRASMVALPKKMRQDYVDKISSFLAINGDYYLFIFTYDQTLMSGPPFSIALDEITERFKTYSRVDVVFEEKFVSDFQGQQLDSKRSVLHMRRQ
jgi:thiopurine S-methyltransferase